MFDFILHFEKKTKYVDFEGQFKTFDQDFRIVFD